MSWYNNTSTDFIDATQTFTGGSTTIINGGDNGGQGEISDVLELRQNVQFQKKISFNGLIGIGQPQTTARGRGSAAS